ncbi:MAG: hypothetical protein RXR01_08360 [Thermoproteus sp.]
MTYLLGLDAVRIATKRTIGLLREAPRLKRLLETGRVEKEYLERLSAGLHRGRLLTCLAADKASAPGATSCEKKMAVRNNWFSRSP